MLRSFQDCFILDKKTDAGQQGDFSAKGQPQNLSGGTCRTSKTGDQSARIQHKSHIAGNMPIIWSSRKLRN
jgi:hypothetical protein